MTFRYPKIPLADFQCLCLGACANLATTLPEFDMSGLVWLASHIKLPTSSRNGHNPSGSS